MTTIYDTSTLTAHFAVGSENEAAITNAAMSSLKHIPLSFADSVGHKYYGDMSYVAPAPRNLHRNTRYEMPYKEYI